MPKNKLNQAPVEVDEDLDDEVDLEETLDDEDMGEDTDAEVEEKEPELTQEQKDEKIRGLVLTLHEAKADKNVGKQKKTRRQLRKLGFYMSKEKDKALEIYLESKVQTQE